MVVPSPLSPSPPLPWLAATASGGGGDAPTVNEGLPHGHNTILVTGAAGFIGSHTAQALLRRGHSVLLVDNLNDYYDVRQKQANLDAVVVTYHATRATFPQQRIRIAIADLADTARIEALFSEEKPAAVIHLAARAGVRPSLSQPLLYVSVNITATTALMGFAHQHGCRHFVYASSSSVYGSQRKVPFSESDPCDAPASPYAATKRACELMAHTYAHLYDLPATGLRFFTVYGPRGRPDMAPYMFVARARAGQPIRKYGDGSSCRDYTYIDDIVHGVLAALDHPAPRKAEQAAAGVPLANQTPPAQLFNLGNSDTVSLNEFIAVVERTTGAALAIEPCPDQPGDVPRTYADLQRARASLGYAPRVRIEEGMRRFVAWFMTQRDAAFAAPPAGRAGAGWGDAWVLDPVWTLPIAGALLGCPSPRGVCAPVPCHGANPAAAAFAAPLSPPLRAADGTLLAASSSSSAASSAGSVDEEGTVVGSAGATSPVASLVAGAAGAACASANASPAHGKLITHGDADAHPMATPPTPTLLKP